MIRTLFITTLIVAFAIHAPAQAKVDLLSYQAVSRLTSKLQLGVQKYVQYYTDSSGNLLQINTLKTRTLQKDPADQNVLQVIQRYNKNKEVDADTAFVRLSDFQPIAFRTHIASGGYRENVLFQPDSIITRIYYTDSLKQKNYARIETVFISTTEQDLISLLPLREGYMATFNLVNPGVRHTDMVFEIEVMGKEMITLSDQSLKETYLVKAGFPKFNSFSHYWFSVDKQVLLKHRFKMRNGTFFIQERIMP